MTEWSKQDSTAARLQGWDVFDIWEGRAFSEIQRYDSDTPFKSDEEARAFVSARATSSTDLTNLYVRAWSIVFRSKVAVPTKRKKK